MFANTISGNASPRRWSALGIATSFLFGASLAIAGGPVGGSYWQTVRIHAAAAQGTSCIALAKIHIGDLLPAVLEHRFSLASGQAGFVDLNLNRLVDRPGRRVKLLPYIQVFGGRCQSAIEIFENFTGRTTAYLPNAELDGQPEVEIPPVPVGRGQILRFGAARGFDPQPDPPRCAATLAFTDSRGNAVGPTKTIDLRVGQYDFVDLKSQPASSRFR